ncbi:MAG: RNA polymerase sigma factor RpoD/SigA [Solirubrobacterales bacterium]|nr:RNA polymerase sigma factor RpoD/SigA [Solirubrobacterales bacterium]
MRPDSPRSRGDEELQALRRRAIHGRLLSAAEEVRLAKRIERGDRQAKECMVESNLRLVFAIARSYRGLGVPFADIVQEGMIGLMRAVERFDHRRGVKFSTYAVWWIRRSMRDAVASAQLIRIPPRANQKLAAVRRAQDELGRLGPGSAPIAAVANRTGLSEQTVRSLLGAARVTASLDEPVGEDGAPLGSLVADDGIADPSERAIAAEESTLARGMLSLLPERHRSVLVRRYGLGQQPPQSHEQIAGCLGVGPERSRQLEREALHRLRTVAAARAA